MNIRPKYRDGIELSLDQSYDILVTKEGYESYRSWIRLREPRQVISIRLKSSLPVVQLTTESRREGQRVIEPSMISIDGGKFWMGNSEGYNERPRRQVSVQGFLIGEYEVTFEEYDAFAKATGRVLPDDEGWGRGRRPVINVSWVDATAFADWLSQQSGKQYRLPTEAEWEYAARAGTSSAYSFGSKSSNLCQFANISSPQCSNSLNRTAPVGRYKPNAYGLHDMHGNVWEWTQDCWNRTYKNAPITARAWMTGDCESRVLRGGSWFGGAERARSAARLRSFPNRGNKSRGFRMARTP